VRIEPNLENVVMGALAKDPEARWQSAEDFAAALEACRPYVEAQQHGDGDTALAAAPVPVPVLVEDEPRDRDRERPNRWLLWGLGLLVLALIALMAYAFTRPEKVDVPRVTGLQLAQARERLDRAGFDKVEVERERSFADVDRVLRQDPDSGEAAAQDDPVTLFVSDGPGKVRVPSVRNTPQERAIKDLDKVGLKVTADPQPSDTVKKGFAIGTSPRAGAEVDRGARVRLFVSSGPERITVPDVVGVTRETAESRITDAGLEVTVETEETDAAEDGEVLRQSPEGGTQADRGDEVTIVVAQEPEQVSVPNVEGLSRADAVAALRDAGLQPAVRERTTDSEAEDGTVLEQRPGAGLTVDAGDSVIIFVGAFEAPDESTPPSEEPLDSPPPTSP
jgi:serine/threonine-protein kinase